MRKMGPSRSRRAKRSPTRNWGTSIGWCRASSASLASPAHHPAHGPRAEGGAHERLSAMTYFLRAVRIGALAQDELARSRSGLILAAFSKAAYLLTSRKTLLW